MPPTYYRNRLAYPGAELIVWFLVDREEVTDYSVVLLVEAQGTTHPVRVYDNRHGRNEMHRHTRGAGKQDAEVFHHGTAGEAMRAAIAEVRAGHERMIEAWQSS